MSQYRKPIPARLLVLLGAMSLAGGCATQDARSTAATGPEAPAWAFVIHGGAGTIARGSVSPEREAEYRASLSEALTAGAQILDAGGSGLDAVEAAIRLMEDDPRFNAGRGAVFTAAGENELDASIMWGGDRDAGAVAGVKTVRHPITLARRVMDASPHVMLSGSGAAQFAQEQGLELVDPSFFATDARRRALERALELRNQGADLDAPMKWGTVGAVALDQDGHLSAGTSTGGMTAKLWGRIGDAPIIGAGTYADDESCAVSATGHGEYFIRVAVARMICVYAQGGDSLEAAAHRALGEVEELGGTGGVIVLDQAGAPVWAFNTPGMYRARIVAGGAPEVAIFGDEEPGQ